MWGKSMDLEYPSSQKIVKIILLPIQKKMKKKVHQKEFFP